MPSVSLGGARKSLTLSIERLGHETLPALRPSEFGQAQALTLHQAKHIPFSDFEAIPFGRQLGSLFGCPPTAGE